MVLKTLLVTACLGLFASDLFADDYIIRLDALKQALKKDSNELIGQPDRVCSVELLCALGKRTSTKVVIGKETVVLAVAIESVIDGVAKVAVHYQLSKDTGESIPDVNGTRKPSPQITVYATPAVAIRLNECFEAGGLITSTKDSRWKDAFIITVKASNVVQ